MSSTGGATQGPRGLRRRQSGGAASSQSAASSDGAPAPKVFKVENKTSVDICVAPFGKDASFSGDVFKDISEPCSVLLIQCNATHTNLYGFAKIMDAFLEKHSASTAPEKELPASVKEFPEFSMKLVPGRAPHHWVALYCAGDGSSVVEALGMVLQAVKHALSEPKFATVADKLVVNISNMTDLDLDETDTTTLTLKWSSTPSMPFHVLDGLVPHPDGRIPTLKLALLAAGTSASSTLLGGFLKGKEKSKEPCVIVPQYTGFWWGSRTVLSTFHFRKEERQAGSTQDWHQAPAVGFDDEGKETVGAMLTAWKDMPMLIRTTADVADSWKDILDKPHLKVELVK